MIYEKHADLIERKSRLGLNNRDVAAVLRISPSSAASKLLGFVALRDAERQAIVAFFDKVEQAQKAEAAK